MTPNTNLAAFQEALRAAAECIDASYFQLPVAGRAGAVLRERVYAYELYHQLRTKWQRCLSPYSLGAEVDKTGHPSFRDSSLSRSNPDLIVHLPGTMSRNLAVVEIKSGEPDSRSILDDLRKLTQFCSPNGGGYAGGLFLVSGTRSQLVNRLRQRCESSARQVCTEQQCIILVLHKSPNTELCAYPLPLVTGTIRHRPLARVRPWRRFCEIPFNPHQYR